jgi:protein CpxP
MKRSTKIIVGSLVGLGLVGAVTAKQFSHGEHESGFSGHHRGDWVSKRIAWKLDLDDQQRIELDRFKASVLERMDTLRAARVTTDQLQSVLNTELDQVKAMQLLEAKLQGIRNSAPELLTAFAGFYDSLDSSQQAKMSEMIEARMANRGHKGRHHDGTKEK